MQVNPKELWINDPEFTGLDERGIPTLKRVKDKQNNIV
jgi:hypothetical protein